MNQPDAQGLSKHSGDDKSQQPLEKQSPKDRIEMKWLYWDVCGELGI